MATRNGVRWRMQGRLMVACNCDYGCPCNFNARPTQGHCEGGWTWHVDEGHYGDVRLDGLNFSVLSDYPGAIHEGNGEALLLIDERASPAQQEAVEAFVSGQIGGPFAVLRWTIARLHGPRLVPYELRMDEVRSSVRAGRSLELALEPIRNPVTGAEVFPRVVLPQGIVFRDGAMAASGAFRVDGEIGYDHSGKYAAYAAFEYSGP